MTTTNTVMTIISVTVKKGLASLDFDNPEQLLCENRPVLASLFYERGLKKGSELSPVACCELLEQSETKRAKSRAVWLLSKKGYSSAGLRKKLNDKFIKKAVDALTITAEPKHELIIYRGFFYGHPSHGTACPCVKVSRL